MNPLPLIQDMKEPTPERSSNINNLFESHSQIGNPPIDIEEIMRGTSKIKNGGCLFKKTSAQSVTRQQ
jgi:hypothetical protein